MASSWYRRSGGLSSGVFELVQPSGDPPPASYSGILQHPFLRTGPAGLHGGLRRLINPHLHAEGLHGSKYVAALELVGVTGFEPATPCSQSGYSTRLSYTPIWSKWPENMSFGPERRPTSPQMQSHPRPEPAFGSTSWFGSAHRIGWRAPAVSSKSRLECWPIAIDHGIPGSIAIAALIDRCLSKIPSNVKPRRKAAVRDGAFSASHFHS